MLSLRAAATPAAPRTSPWNSRQIDYGYVKFGETRTFEIKVTNTGDGSLRFTEKPYIEVLEGC